MQQNPCETKHPSSQKSMNIWEETEALYSNLPKQKMHIEEARNHRKSALSPNNSSRAAWKSRLDEKIVHMIHRKH